MWVTTRRFDRRYHCISGLLVDGAGERNGPPKSFTSTGPLCVPCAGGRARFILRACRPAWRAKVVLIWMLSGLAAPYVRGSFERLARRAPSGSFLEATLLELSTNYSAMLIHLVAGLLAAVIIESIDFLFMLAAALRMRPAPTSAIVKR